MKAAYFQSTLPIYPLPQGVTISTSNPVVQVDVTSPLSFGRETIKEQAGVVSVQPQLVIIEAEKRHKELAQPGVIIVQPQAIVEVNCTVVPAQIGAVNITPISVEPNNLQKLRTALFESDLEKVKEIVGMEGIKIITDRSSDSEPPLVTAMVIASLNDSDREKSVEILEFLLNLDGLDQHITSSSGSSFLFSALTIGNQIAVDKFIELGANTVRFDKNYKVGVNNPPLIDYLCQNSKKAGDLLVELNQESMDPASILDKLKNIIADEHRPTLQAVVTKGGNALLETLNASGEFRQIKKDFTKYGIKYSAKYKSGEDTFIITSTYYQDESGEAFNTKEMKEESKTFFKDGKIYSAKTNQVIEEVDNALYAVSKKGNLYINLEGDNFGKHHSFFLKGKPGDDLFGYGRPVACAGHLSIKSGKITALSGDSGHFDIKPNQIKVVAYYLARQDVVVDKVDLTWYDRAPSRNLFEDFASWHSNIDEQFTPWPVIGDILDQYAELAY